MSTAEKLWKEHHQSQVSRLQQQVSEATPPGPSPSSSVESAVVERALQEAKEKWEEEKQAKIQEALDAAKQVRNLDSMVNLFKESGLSSLIGLIEV